MPADEQSLAADIDQPIATNVDHGAGVVVNDAAVIEEPQIRATAGHRTRRNAVEHHPIGQRAGGQ